MLTSKLYFDINLLGIKSFVNNNYAYIARDDAVQFLLNQTLPEYYTEENELRSYTIYRDNESKNGFQNLKIIGPGATLVYGKHAFGLQTSVREITSFEGVPHDVAIFLYEAIDYEKQHQIDYSHSDPIKAGSLTWFELGLSYAYNFHRYRWNYWSVGITIKPLFGYAGFYAILNNMDYRVENDSLAVVSSASFKYGISLPISYQTNDLDLGPKIRGFGFGIDLGVTFQKTTKGHENFIFSGLCEQPFEKYNYRIGFSILDLGYIKFTKNAIYESYTNASTTWYKPDDVLPNSSINEIVGKVNYYFDPVNEDSEKENSFIMYLPPMLSLQSDVWLNKQYYLNAMLFYGIKMGKGFVTRPSIFSISPRYETARMEFSVPISVYKWKFGKPRVGIALRYGNVFVGSDNLNAIFAISDFTGLDFYAGIRLNLSNTFKLNFIKGNCGMKKANNIETFDFRNF
ncbi:MAG: DUF5723 family protein [Bacteroidales bacterium]|nr:DUF5723 family protein [Bacteroidales bacterium]MCF8405044.1 DUF5723 family protein [Bacteroidales bacterium]